MNDREFDRALPGTPPVDPKLLARISGEILPRVTPVRPLPARRVIEVQLIAAAAVIAFGGASRVGFYAIHRLSGAESAAIFTAVAVLIWLAASAATAAIIPGARRVMRPLALIALACAALVAVFAVLFHDYSMARFLHQGIGCFKAGLTDALPAAVVCWLVLRRGFAVDPAAAGAAAGALAGMAGVLMLELHCPIFKAPHVMVWHVAVIPVCGAVGAALGAISSRKRGGAE